MSNPLLDNFDLPLFSRIKPEHVKPAVEETISKCKQTIEKVTSSPGPYTWSNLVEPLEEIDNRLSRLWSPVSHMNSVVSSDELREVHDACLPLLSEYGTFVGQHQGLYQAYESLANSEEYQLLSKAQKQVIDHALRDFRLSGVALGNDKKKAFADIKSELSELSSRFSNNLLDATHAWTKLITDEKDLSGLPEMAIEAAKHLATEKGESGWLFTLDFPSYFPVMTYADNQQFREEMYTAYATRASDQGPNANQWDNGSIINRTLELRHQLAELLGFDNYAEKSLATKMADTPQTVMSFLEELAQKSLPQAKADLAELIDFTKENYGVEELNAWDLGYYSEKLKQQKYAISDEVLRPYFPENKVVSGLFKTVQRLFDIQITERFDVDTWHKDVRFFEIFDDKEELRGSFYLDLYAREKKRGGAWMDECRVRRLNACGDLESPVAYLTCNFNGPVGDKPALFTHDEVVTLFHEFGHGIHHMLTKIDVAGVSGINGVPWDAVELPSQFLENWCYEKEALAFISGHYETKEPLPDELLEKMLKARNFQSAMQMVRQLEFSLFDFEIHKDYQQSRGIDVQQVLNAVREKVSVFAPPAFNRFQHSFSHIFAGGYAAGYYSYKWAEVLSSDAFSKFEEEGIFNKKTGAEFLHNILEKGGSEEPLELFEAFRGRKPTIDALLRHSGITAN